MPANPRERAPRDAAVPAPRARRRARAGNAGVAALALGRDADGVRFFGRVLALHPDDEIHKRHLRLARDRVRDRAAPPYQ